MIIVQKVVGFVSPCNSYELVNEPEENLIKVNVDSGFYYIDMADQYDFYDIETPDNNKQWTYIDNIFTEIIPPQRPPELG